MYPSVDSRSGAPLLFLYVNFQHRCGIIPASDIYKGSGNSEEGEKGQVPIDLSR